MGCSESKTCGPGTFDNQGVCTSTLVHEVATGVCNVTDAPYVGQKECMDTVSQSFGKEIEQCRVDKSGKPVSPMAFGECIYEKMPKK